MPENANFQPTHSTNHSSYFAISLIIPLVHFKAFFCCSLHFSSCVTYNFIHCTTKYPLSLLLIFLLIKCDDLTQSLSVNVQLCQGDKKKKVYYIICSLCTFRRQINMFFFITFRRQLIYKVNLLLPPIQIRQLRGKF